MNRSRIAAGGALVLAALGLMALTPMNPLWCVAGVLVGVILAVPHDQVRLAGAFLAVLPLAAFAGRTVNFGAEPVPFEVKSLADGARSGRSPDLLGLVTVQATIVGGRVTAASAVAPSWVGFDAGTLDRVSAALVANQKFQGLPGEYGEPATDLVARAALSRLLAR